MFSVENPPTDPPCPQLKPCNARASHKRGLPETDLSKPAIVNEASLPKFSIRDYVLSSRGKDIKANWPFSSKTLQLCLKHGVKDLLPPFQPPRKVRTQSIGGCTVENANPEKPSINNFDGEPSQSDHYVGLNMSNLAKPNDKHSQTCIDSNSSRYEGGNDLRSTTTSLAPSEIDSVPTFRPSNSPVEFGSLSKALVEAEAGEPLVSLKSERTAKQLGKKCRFAIKHGAQAYQALCEDFVSNCTSASETMASKTCPVCRIFSSSSNTTLNAHIDQCLSAESTPKWSLDSKTTKYKFKPKKTKLLVDIYVTASPCTLEDLDRRNGTTWALGSRLPTADIEKSETHYEGNRERASLAHPKVTANQGEVYIDSKGTKLRILSAFNDVSLSRVRDSLGSTRSTNEDEGKKLHSPKRKKCHALKYQKVRKLVVQRKTISPLKDFSTEIDRSYDGYSGAEEDWNMDKHQQKPRKSHDSGCLRQWIRAKRTGVVKKVSSTECYQNLTGELPVQTDQSCLVDVNTDKFSDLNGTNSSENAMFSPEDGNIMETKFRSYDDQILERNGRSSGSKKPESPLCVEFPRDVEAVPLVKENGCEQKKGSTFAGDRYLVKPPNCNGHYMASSSKKRPNIVNRYSSDILSKDCHATALKATKFNSLSEKMCLLSKPSSIKGSKSPLVKKHSALKKSRPDLGKKIDETMRSFNSETYRISGMPDESFESWSKEEQTIEMLPKSKVLLNEKGQMSVSQRNETRGLTSLSSGSLISNNCDDENLDSSVQGGLKYFDGKKGVECGGEVVQSHGESAILESSSKRSSLMESSPNIYELLNSSMTGSGFLKFSTNSKQPVYGVEGQDLPTKLKLDDQPESIGMEDEARAMVRLNIDPTAEMHSETSQANSFDPILIPGPPGSFLPSPGEMQSDDFQGNSSLTTSQIHSSQDEQDFTDGASSDSPISASSTFSTFSAAKSDLNYLPTVHRNGFETKSSSVLSGCKLKPPMENSAYFAVATTTETKNISCDRENLQVGQISLEETNLSFTNGEKLCCCQKKKIPPWVNLSYQQPQLLKYRSFPSVSIPCCKQKMGYNLNGGPNKFDPRPEILPSCSCNRFENVAAPSGYSPEGIFPFVSSPKAGVKFANCCNFESTTSSSSKPVLRLMGKNLMVMNNNEDASPTLEQPKPQPPTKNVLEFPTYLKNSSGQSANKGFNLFHQDSSVLDTDSCSHRGRHFDVRLLDGFRSNSDLKTSQSSVRRPAVVYPPNQTGNGYYTTSLQPHKLRYNHCLAPHDSDKNRAKENAMCNVGELMSAPHSQQMNANSSSIPVDGYPNCVPKMTPCVSKYSRGFEASLKLTPGI